MIPPHAPMTVQWVDLQDVKFDGQPIDRKQVEFYILQYAGHDGHVAPPILNDDLTIRDGRHRLLAHVETGRRFARVLVVHGVAHHRESPLAA